MVSVVFFGSLFFVFYKSPTIQLSNISNLIPTPPLPVISEVHAIYITANTAHHDNMENIIKLIKKTKGVHQLNAVVIDVQNGNSFQLDNDLKILVRRLRFLGIFPIARLSVFQDNELPRTKPETAIKRKDGNLWRDRGGRYWVDPASKEVWEHVLELSRQIVDAGFGEINFDYIRFPSDGNMDDIIYPSWDKNKTKTEVILDFSRFIKSELKKEYPDLKLTADLFGYTFLRTHDLGIGQSATEMAEIFDDIAPMIYPSHYDSGNFNFENPADHPYEVVYGTLEKGKEIFTKNEKVFSNIRPWIQDFNLGAIYTPEMVQEQIKAIEDMGLTRGWMIWNPNNKYREAIFNE